MYVLYLSIVQFCGTLPWIGLWICLFWAFRISEYYLPFIAYLDIIASYDETSKKSFQLSSPSCSKF